MANEKFKDKIIKVFGMEDDDMYDDEYYEEDQEEMTETPRNSLFSGQKPAQPAAVRKSSGLGLGAGPNVLVLNPETFDDAPSIVLKIKADNTVVVNLKNTEYEEGRKIFDFLSGAVYALEGSINRIAESVYILAPSEVSVSTKMEKEEAADSITPLLEFDEK